MTTPNGPPTAVVLRRMLARADADILAYRRLRERYRRGRPPKEPVAGEIAAELRRLAEERDALAQAIQVMQGTEELHVHD